MNLRYRYARVACLLARGAPAKAEISPETAARNQDRIIRSGVSNSIGDAVSCTGNLPALFLLALGGNAIHVGVLATVRAAFPLVRIIGLKLLPRAGKTRLCVAGRLFSVIPLVLLALVAVRPGTPAAAAVAIFLFALRGLAVNCGNTGWQPIIQDSVAQDGLGAFYARLRTRLRLVEVVFPLAIGFFLGTHPAAARFTPLFLVAAAAMVSGCGCFAGMVEKPSRPRDSSIINGLWKALGREPVLRYSLFSAAYMLINTAYRPLWVVLLRDHGIPVNQLVWLGTFGSLAGFLGISRWGTAADRLGSRRVISLAMIPQALLGLAWLFLPAGGKGVFGWALFLFTANGFLVGGLGMGKTRALMQAVPASRQAEGFVAAGYCQALGGAAGGIIGALLFRWSSGLELPPAGPDPRHFFLAAAQLSLLFPWLLSRRLADRVRT